jgi:tetratricopeptide (TPR) repeat protein
MKRAFARVVTVAVLVSVPAAGCGWLESSAAANRKADDALGRGDWDLAITKYSKVISKNPKYAQAWRRRGFCYLQKGELTKARSDMERAMQLDPKFAGTHYVMATSLVTQRKLDEAIRQFQEALERDKAAPGHAAPTAIHSGLANALTGQGRIDEAMEQCRQSLQANPHNPEAHYFLACGLMAHRQLKQAEEEFRKALDGSLQPNVPAADNNRALILATCPIRSLRNGAEAVKLAEQANKKTGEKNLDFLDTLAAAYAEAGRFDEAIATARKAIAIATAQDSPELVRMMRARIALYEARKPLREPPEK